MSQKSGPSRNQAGQELEEPEPPELEGWLSKLKHSQMSFFGAWNRRFFRINRRKRTLEYYRSLQKLKGGTPSGTVSLYEINAVRDFDGSSFCVETTSRTFFLRADTPAEHSSWLSPLESYVSERKEWTARKIATQSGSYG